MTIGFGPRRSILPANNLGLSNGAERRVTNYAVRAADKAREAVLVDAHYCRVWARVLRGSRACPCSSSRAVSDDFSNDVNPENIESRYDIVLSGGDGDDLHNVSSGQGPHDPNHPAEPNYADELPENNDPLATLENSDIMNLLMGNGKRCGLCWGTGYLDSYRLVGGERILLCAVDTLGTEIVSDTGVDVDDSFQTPTLVGPGTVVWKIELPISLNTLDAIRVCNGLVAADRDEIALRFSATNLNDSVWVDAYTFFGDVGQDALDPNLPRTFYARVELADGAQMSHVDIIMRSEKLIALQLPQLQQAAATELVAPFIASDFELDPRVGSIERSTLIEVPARYGRNATVWFVTDVMVKQTANGQIFGVTGQVKNCQPTDVMSAASIDESVFVGSFSGGTSLNTLEPPSIASDLYDGRSDDRVLQTNNNIVERKGGGGISRTITLSSSPDFEDTSVDTPRFIRSPHDYVFTFTPTNGQTQFHIPINMAPIDPSIFMTVNGVNYYDPDVIAPNNQIVEWQGPFSLTPDDDVKISLVADTYIYGFAAVARQTQFLIEDAIDVNWGYTRLMINGEEFAPPDIEVLEHAIIWKKNITFTGGEQIVAIVQHK